jgi:hypothetical protein
MSGELSRGQRGFFRGDASRQRTDALLRKAVTGALVTRCAAGIQPAIMKLPASHRAT